MRLDPQSAGHGTAEGDDKPTPIKYVGNGLNCRIIGYSRLATARDRHCCHSCSGSPGFLPFPDNLQGNIFGAAGPHEGTCLPGMPGDDEDDVDYIHPDHYEPNETCSALGCFRLCAAPNYNKCCRLCGISSMGIQTVPGIVFWQHELRCLRAHGTQHVRMQRDYDIVNDLD